MKPFLKTAIAFYLIISESFVSAQQAVEFTANYKASTNGIGATALRKLEILDGGLYRLSTSKAASQAGQHIAKIIHLSAERLVPLSYNYLLTGISTEASSINYDWDAGLALNNENGENSPIKLTSGVMDELSHQFALRQQIKKGNTDTLEFQLIDGDEIELHRYRLVGKEVLNTALGKLNSTQIELAQVESNERTTKIWLADDWQYLLIKIEQLNKSGLSIKLELESATVSGKKVVPMLEPTGFTN